MTDTINNDQAQEADFKALLSAVITHPYFAEYKNQTVGQLLGIKEKPGPKPDVDYNDPQVYADLREQDKVNPGIRETMLRLYMSRCQQTKRKYNTPFPEALNKECRDFFGEKYDTEKNRIRPLFVHTQPDTYKVVVEWHNPKTYSDLAELEKTQPGIQKSTLRKWLNDRKKYFITFGHKYKGAAFPKLLHKELVKVFGNLYGPDKNGVWGMTEEGKKRPKLELTKELFKSQLSSRISHEKNANNGKVSDETHEFMLKFIDYNPKTKNVHASWRGNKTIPTEADVRPEYLDIFRGESTEITPKEIVIKTPPLPDLPEPPKQRQTRESIDWDNQKTYSDLEQLHPNDRREILKTWLANRRGYFVNYGHKYENAKFPPLLHAELIKVFGDQYRQSQKCKKGTWGLKSPGRMPGAKAQKSKTSKAQKPAPKPAKPKPAHVHVFSPKPPESAKGQYMPVPKPVSEDTITPKATTVPRPVQKLPSFIKADAPVVATPTETENKEDVVKKLNAQITLFETRFGLLPPNKIEDYKNSHLGEYWCDHFKLFILPDDRRYELSIAKKTAPKQVPVSVPVPVPVQKTEPAPAHAKTSVATTQPFDMSNAKPIVIDILTEYETIQEIKFGTKFIVKDAIHIETKLYFDDTVLHIKFKNRYDQQHILFQTENYDPRSGVLQQTFHQFKDRKITSVIKSTDDELIIQYTDEPGKKLTKVINTAEQNKRYFFKLNEIERKSY